MDEWWRLLSTYQRFLFIISSTATLIFFIQLIFLLIGFGEGSDGDVDDIEEINNSNFGELFGLKLITLRGIFAFFCIGGWVTFVLLEVTSNVALSTCLGVVAGIGTMFLLAFFMKQAMKLEENGNIDVNNAIGLTGTVYLTIPKENSGVGKVNVIVQERLTEYDAITNDLEDLKNGQSIKIIACKNNVLEVTRL